MQPVQALHTGWCCRPTRGEHASGARLGCLERDDTAAMEKAGIVEAGHDGHERIELRAVFVHSAVSSRVQRRQTAVDRMREGRLRLASNT